MKLTNLVFLLISLSLTTACSLDSSEHPQANEPSSPNKGSASAPQQADRLTEDLVKPASATAPTPAPAPQAEIPAPEALTVVSPQIKSPLTPILECNDLQGMDDFIRINPMGIWSRDDDGKTVFHFVRSREMAEKLWNLKAPRTSKFKPGTPLHEIPDKNGNLPIHSLVKAGQSDVVAYAINQYCPAKNGIDWWNLLPGNPLNAQNSLGQTPLHIAVMNGDRGMIDQLLACRFLDVNAVDNQNRTALGLALANKRADLVRPLLDAGGKRSQ